MCAYLFTANMCHTANMSDMSTAHAYRVGSFRRYSSMVDRNVVSYVSLNDKKTKCVTFFRAK